MKAQQTRERILAAAVAEFGAKGYAGARTAGIAARAGVNQQLIAYHFGGKGGLLDELRRRWDARQSSIAPAGATFAETFAGYLDATLDEPAWARLVVWEALGDRREDAGQEEHSRRSALEARLQAGVERIRQRQRDGELSDRIEPEFVLLLSHLLAFAPIAMPQIVEGIFGVEPLSGEYRRRCREQLARIVAPVSGTESEPS
ncbi:MAG: TetR/AcrR family transcriptional regulator [Catenulispora sp.]|nr:TetR/AcrR family transcriptional regulator [Catenulispora sp.]